MREYKILSDTELVGLLQKADGAAYAEIYKRYWAILFRHARKMLESDDEAKDVVQDLFMVLWTRCPELNLTGSLSSYLYSAVRYKVFDLIDRSKVRENYFASLEDFIQQGNYTIDNIIREKELAVQIEKEIALLPPKMCEAFELSRKSLLSHKEIATKMGISDETVKKHIQRALKILRPKFDVTVLMVLYFFGK